jgi:HK97 family phage prohead protease/HK97 family phage major capsid protein
VVERGYEMFDMFGEYTEVVSRDAFDATLSRADLDVPLVLGHDSLRRIARTTNGSLTLSASDEGLTIHAPNLDPTDADVAYIAPKIRSGLVDEMSFMFRIEAGEWSEDFSEYRINRVELHRGDVSIVGYGANPHTHIETPVRSPEPAGNEAREGSAADALDDRPAAHTPTIERSPAMSEVTPVEPAAEVVEPTPEVREDHTADLQARIADLEEQARIRHNAEEAQRDMSTNTATVQVGREARTYNPDSDRRGESFLRDFAASQLGDYGAQARLAQHMERAQYLQRDVATTALAGLTVPQYLTDLVAPLARAGRPLADNCRSLPLPADGMTVTISRITTGTTAAIQATQAAGVSETDIDDTELVVNVRTIAGQQDVSFQALSRSVGAQQVILEDLVGAYHTALDSSIINDAGGSGTHLGIRSTVGIAAVTYTDATPTASEAWGPLWDLQQKIETGVYKSATHFVMHPRRWAWWCSAIGTNNTMVNSGAVQQLGREDSKEYGAGVRGIIAGLPVIVDANLPLTLGGGTEDVILAVTNSELFLWEDAGAPLFIRADQPGAGNLMAKLVVYGYSAFAAGRYPGAHGTITGSGLATPTFGIAAS